MYEEVIEKIPEKEWKTGDIKYLTPFRIIYHVIESDEYYSGNLTEFDCGYGFNVGLTGKQQKKHFQVNHRFWNIITR